MSLRGAVFNEKISCLLNPFSRENASEKTSHFHFALPYENERRRGREIHTHTERKEEEKTFRQTRVLRFTRFKETSRSRAHHHPKGTINSASAIARERKSYESWQRTSTTAENRARTESWTTSAAPSPWAPSVEASSTCAKARITPRAGTSSKAD